MKWAYYISGFKEHRGKINGTRSIQEEIRDKYQSSDICVFYNEWNDDPKKYARYLANQWQGGDTLLLHGYSWGCGNWVLKFLRELYRINPEIYADSVTLVDPVVRSRLMLFRWFGITDLGRIILPPNIHKLMVFYQRNNEPNASKIRIYGCKNSDIDFKKLKEPVEAKVYQSRSSGHRILVNIKRLDEIHATIDSADQVVKYAMDKASELLGTS